MPIDPRIALGVQAPQIESPMNVMANALKLRAMQNENALFEQQQRQAAAQAAERNRLRGLLAGNATAADLRQAGFMDEALKLSQEERLGLAETRAQAEEQRAAEEAKRKSAEIGFGLLSLSKDPESFGIARRLYAAMGGDLTVIPENYDPKWIETTKRAFGPELEFRDIEGGIAGLSKRTGETESITYKIPEPEPVVRQRERVAAAGAPPPSKFETAYGVDVSKAAAARDEAAVAAAQQAVGDLEGDYRVLALLAQGKPVTGAFAPIKLEFDKLRNIVKGDKEAAERVTDTELLNSLLGKDVFASIQALGVGARGLDTPAEREYLREVIAGTISMSPDTLARMTQIRANIRERAIDKYNARVERGELDRYFQYSGLPKQKLPKPERPKAPAAAAASAAAEVEVNIPGRGVVRFPNQKAADDFKKAAGL